jgi:hypothetical protein
MPSSMSWATTMLLMTVLFAPEASTSWANATDDKELKADEPDVWNELEAELTPEQSLQDVPGNVSELVKALLHHHADLFKIGDFEFEDDEEDDDFFYDYG